MYGPLLINLDTRTDRLAEAEKEFQKLSLNYIRIKATTDPNPILGCMDSHCRCLEQFLQTTYDSVMICEDDIQFTTDKTTLNTHITEFLNTEADVLCLGFYASNPTEWSSLFYRSNDIQSRVCYIVKRQIAKELHAIWRKLYMFLIEINNKPSQNNWYSSIYKELPIKNKACDIYRGDQVWKILQQKYYFLIPKFHIAIQRPSFSDIERCFVNYKV
jgi:hypothetical protein